MDAAINVEYDDLEQRLTVASGSLSLQIDGDRDTFRRVADAKSASWEDRQSIALALPAASVDQIVTAASSVA